MEWGTKQFNHFLRTLFPTLFRYLGTFNRHVLQVKNEPDDTGIKRIDYSWPYILLQKDRKKYVAVDHMHPTGSSYRDNLSGGSTHASFRGKAIFLGTSISPRLSSAELKKRTHAVTRIPIPQEVLNRWFAPVVAPIIPHALPAGKRGRGEASVSIL